jgi:hypothetical protein
MAQTAVKFRVVYGTKAKYSSATSSYANDIFVCTDTHELYMRGIAVGLDSDSSNKLQELIDSAVTSITYSGGVLKWNTLAGEAGTATLLGTTVPKADGTASAGTSTQAARADHVHPKQADATSSASGLMSAADKKKLDGIAAGADKTTVDSALSATSTNPVQNKAVKAALDKKADLDSTGKVPSSQLPSYVDDVLEYTSKSEFPATGETGKIYVDTTANLTYRWGGSSYVEISKSLALGETSSTAYAGDKGKALADRLTQAEKDIDAVQSKNTTQDTNISSILTRLAAAEAQLCWYEA